jgi:transcription elongation factor Elf1
MTTNRHEPCPVCGGQMIVCRWKIFERYYLKCSHCSLMYGFSAHSGMSIYHKPEPLWDAWDTGISEQRGKWLEEHPCDGCKVEET